MLATPPTALDYWTLGIAIAGLGGSIAVAIATHLQWNLARKVRRDQLEPYVVVDIVPRSEYTPVLWLTIENIGKTVAHNVRVSVTPMLRSTTGCATEMRLAEAMARPIPSMPPGKKIGYFVDSAIGLLGENSNLPMVYTFTVDADGPFGKVDTATYVVDLNVRRGSLMNPETVVAKLGEISDTLKSWDV